MGFSTSTGALFQEELANRGVEVVGSGDHHACHLKGDHVPVIADGRHTVLRRQEFGLRAGITQHCEFCEGVCCDAIGVDRPDRAGPDQGNPNRCLGVHHILRIPVARRTDEP